MSLRGARSHELLGHPVDRSPQVQSLGARHGLSAAGLALHRRLPLEEGLEPRGHFSGQKEEGERGRRREKQDGEDLCFVWLVLVQLTCSLFHYRNSHRADYNEFRWSV